MRTKIISRQLDAEPADRRLDWLNCARPVDVGTKTVKTVDVVIQFLAVEDDSEDGELNLDQKLEEMKCCLTPHSSNKN